ncbi:hypothetical protein PNK_0778 [Candidatus Protochlamydia naegleriophila]|uniref:Uncharacterized protein n=1 Tax=Candidatus Protochlamydia naegleriophila TaxID=389348 RepID=A0A0U5JC85_9BACT|nr:hypothetical protein PNK_0778 [Candidatus Protochlamydia naegleriophila]
MAKRKIERESAKGKAKKGAKKVKKGKLES